MPENKLRDFSAFSYGKQLKGLIKREAFKFYVQEWWPQQDLNL
jgi:hypothetical protein